MLAFNFAGVEYVGGEGLECGFGLGRKTEGLHLAEEVALTMADLGELFGPAKVIAVIHRMAVALVQPIWRAW